MVVIKTKWYGIVFIEITQYSGESILVFILYKLLSNAYFLTLTLVFKVQEIFLKYILFKPGSHWSITAR